MILLFGKCETVDKKSSTVESFQELTLNRLDSLTVNVVVSRLRIVSISALRWTEFHQNRKDWLREIQRFANLSHNLCENDKQTLHDYRKIPKISSSIYKPLKI